jgi:3alpha(or 20beta)-hydroxysteroid dehydrogenase
VGKVVLVTGASGGQGEAEAGLFAAEGATVVVADVEVEAGERLAADLVTFGQVAEFVRLDVADEACWTGVVDGIESRHGRLEVLVNNYGIGDGRAHRRPRSAGVAPAPRHQPLGARRGHAHRRAPDGTRRRWLDRQHLLDPRPDRLRPRGVHGEQVGTARSDQDCELGSPGTIMTPIVAVLSDDVIDNYVRVNPDPRIGAPEEIAWAVLHLASDEASFTTGAELTIEGGFIAGGANRALELAVRAAKDVAS